MKNPLKDAFGSAEFDQNATYGLGNILTMIRKIDDVVSILVVDPDTQKSEIITS